MKCWIQDSRELLLNPTADMDILTQELEVAQTVLSGTDVTFHIFWDTF